MSKKNIHRMSQRNPLMRIVSSAICCMPLLMISGCNEPTNQANTNADPVQTGSTDQFQSISGSDPVKIEFSKEIIQIGLPVEIAAFKSGENSNLAQTACGDCHSTDYPTTQPLLTRAQWKAEIAKMHDKFGAPWGDIFGTLAADGITVNPAGAATIAANLQKIEDYLVANYGKIS